MRTWCFNVKTETLNSKALNPKETTLDGDALWLVVRVAREHIDAIEPRHRDDARCDKVYWWSSRGYS